MLTSHDVGRRVSVRRLEGDHARDVVGHLLDLSGEQMAVLRKNGTVATFDPADVVAAKVVPAQPVRRAWTVPAVSAAEMQEMCSAGWPARESARLGTWQLRAHAGITGRANSALTVGNPGLAMPEALEAVREWYGERRLPPLLQLPLADPANVAMEELGWRRQHVTIVQVAPVGALLASLPTVDGLTTTVAPTPSPEWRALMHDLDRDDPEKHVQILTGPPVVGFATVLRDAEPVGIGRVSVEGRWAGITSVDVAPTARRQGVGTAVMRSLVGLAAERGAEATYLQVRAANDAALRLYAALGYVTHHPYCYRAPVPAS
ncbi:MAG: N-acetylglutamate synthase [Actinomycetota bacterium]|nr:N-acetylglutamate synthase [Actinomycetota bacterium]